MKPSIIYFSLQRFHCQNNELFTIQSLCTLCRLLLIEGLLKRNYNRICAVFPFKIEKLLN
jgi:hypothetical protein